MPLPAACLALERVRELSRSRWRRLASHRCCELGAHQFRLFETVTGSPVNGGTRVRATALSTHERMLAGGDEEPK